MSKLRQNVTISEGDLDTPAEGDLAAYVVFTQFKEGAPHVYAGWLDAIDDEMAIQFAREHYGQDQECVSIWAIPRPAIAGTEPEYPTSDDEGPSRTFEVFTQKKSGDQHVSNGSVEATSSEAALQSAKAGASGADSVWVVPRSEIAATDKGDVIWRLTDQTYRLARGYSTEVREKWERIRAKRDIEEYEKDDLKDTF